MRSLPTDRGTFTDEPDLRDRDGEASGVVSPDEVDRHCERGLIPDVKGEDSPGLSSSDRVLVAIRKSSVPVRILPACLVRQVRNDGVDAKESFRG